LNVVSCFGPYCTRFRSDPHGIQTLSIQQLGKGKKIWTLNIQQLGKKRSSSKGVRLASESYRTKLGFASSWNDTKPVIRKKVEVMELQIHDTVRA
jgi:hypothetical protein